jgi:transposase
MPSGVECRSDALLWPAGRRALAGPSAGVDGLMWKLCTGAQGRDRPERCGPWQTVYERLTRRRREGLFDRMLDRLRLRLKAEGRIDLDLWCIDSTSVQASRSVAGAGKKEIRRNQPTLRSAFHGTASAPRSTG